LVLEVPIACLLAYDPVICAWTTASRPRNEDFDHDSDDFIQVSRLGMPLVTGIMGLNQPANMQPAEMLRLNTSTPVRRADSQNRLGVIGGDNAGFPNGRRPGDDIVDVTLRVAMGRLITLGLFGTPAQAPSGGLDFTDGAIVNAGFFDNQFPYLKTPLAGSPGAAQPSVRLPPNAVVPVLEAVSSQ
jgi:hypothetical protein